MASEKDQKALALYLLGEPQLIYEERSLAEGLARKEQALFIYMACQPEQRFSREHLATLLWSEVPQSRARYNLRRALWNLRRALNQAGLTPEAYIVVEGSWIHVPPTAPCWVDVGDFEQVLQACFQDPRSRFSPASESIRRIRKALDLYRGDFLAGFSISRAPNFEEWLTFERERLFLLLLRALTSLIQGFIARGERNEAIAACQRLLVLDPLQEDIHRLLMRLYWETGQRPQALRQYRTYRDLLQLELGIEPLEETQDLYRRILQREIAPVSASSSLILTSRLTPPSPATESLPRPRLFSLLDRGLTVRLTLLSAPPGYGKTTLMAQWLDTHSQNGTAPSLGDTRGEQELLFAWYEVSETDNTPLIFVEGLVASVAQMYPAIGQTLQDGIHDLIALQGDPRQVVGLLTSKLASLEPVSFVIILDGVEHLISPVSQKMLQYLVEHLPANGHLYVLTRVDPDLPLPRLRIRGQLLELRAAELRFTDEEITAFLKQAHNLNLSPAEIAELTTRAEGWIAPLWLAANALSRFSSSLNAVWEGLFAYLRDEVLAPQSFKVRDFLLRSAVLDQLNPSLCQAALEVDNPTQWLVELERRNLFLRRVVPQAPPTLAERARGDTEPQYAYHPLFLAFLRAELPYHLSDTESEHLHRQAARTWEKQGNLESALFHYQQIDDEPEIARLLEQIAPAYLQQGQLEPLARWLDQLEPAVRDQHPRLTLNAGRLRQTEGRIEEAHRLYRRAAAGFEAQQDGALASRNGRGDSLLALAELELSRGRYAEGIEFGRQAMDCWDKADTLRHTTGLCIIGQLHACQGNLSDAESTLKQAKQLIIGQDYPLLAFQILRTQAWVACIQGAYHRAMALNRMAEQEAGRNVSPEITAAFRNPMPAILRQWGESEAAWEATHQRLEAARQIQHRLALSRAYTDLGNLYLDREQFAEAESAFRQAIVEAEAAGEDGLQRLCGEVHLVYAHFLQKHATEATEVAEAVLHHSQARAASPLELALAQMAVALAHICVSPSSQGEKERRNLNFSESSIQLLDEAYQAFNQMGVRYGVSMSAALLGLAHLTRSAESQSDHQQQALRYVTEALTLAAAEGYAQTIVTARQALLPLMLFALREGVEPRFVSQVLTQMGSEPLAGIVEMAQDANPIVRERVASALEVIGAQKEDREAALTALKQLTHDPDPSVRSVADQAQRKISR
ncbi:MAG: BTAD domain-containing putative transcriptional regulator [Chloroflexota bacterium]|nr:BTAD domain-containing putative transcriptional regulator [Chloroflexota bacterium]